MEMRTSIFEISPRYVLYYYSDKLYLSDTMDGFGDCCLNQVEEDIVLQINLLHNLIDVWDALKNEYQISEDDEAKALFESYITNLTQRGIIRSGNNTYPVVGKKGFCYPIITTVELTSKCNFECLHCYKEAGYKGGCFIETDLAIRALKALEGKTWQVEFTGGEALMHPDFEKIIQAVNFPSMVLLTNGSLLDHISLSTLKRFSSIQISMYGSSAAEYRKYALSDTFERVCQNIKMLTRENIDVTIAIILRKSNFLRLDDYVSQIEEMGVKYVRFGLTRKIGRNETCSDEWVMTYDDCCRFDVELELLKSKYPGIEFEDLNWKGDFIDRNKATPSIKLKCTAGKKQIVLSEKGIIRPCVLLPAEYFGKFTWDEYINTNEKKKSIC